MTYREVLELVLQANPKSIGSGSKYRWVGSARVVGVGMGMRPGLGSERQPSISEGESVGGRVVELTTPTIVECIQTSKPKP